MRTWFTLALSLFVFSLQPAARAEKPPVVAFLGVEDPGFVFKDKDLDRFEQEVEGLLGEDGLKVLPAKQVRDHLGDESCRRARCWNELGKALGCSKGLRLRIVRSGTVCTLVETMFDTAGRLTIEARTHEAACKVDAVLAVWRKTLPRLAFEETGWKGASVRGDKLPEKLSAEQIDFVFNKHAGDLQRCLDLQKDRDPSVVGKLRLSFVVKPKGRIDRVKVLSAEHREAFVVECMRYVLKSMHFPLYAGQPMPAQNREFQLGQ